MAQQVSEIKASARPRSGKGGARAIRREGRCRASSTATARAREHRPRRPRAHHPHRAAASSCPPSSTSMSTARSARVIPREVQLDPVKDWPHPRRLPARRRRRAHPRQRAGALHQRGPVARPEARRRAQHRAPRGRGDLPGRRHPRPLRVQPRGPGDRPLDPHLGDQDARGRQAHHPQPRLHGRHRRRPQDRGGAQPGAEAAAAEGAAPAEARRAPPPPQPAMPRPPPARRPRGGQGSGRQGSRRASLPRPSPPPTRARNRRRRRPRWRPPRT